MFHHSYLPYTGGYRDLGTWDIYKDGFLLFAFLRYAIVLYSIYINIYLHCIILVNLDLFTCNNAEKSYCFVKIHFIVVFPF